MTTIPNRIVDAVTGKVVFRIKIRHLFLMMLGLLAFIAIAATAWNGQQVLKQQTKARQMEEIYGITGVSLHLAAEMGIERGLAAILMASKQPADAGSRKRLTEARKRIDHLRQTLTVLLERFIGEERSGLIHSHAEVLTRLQKEHLQLRAQVDGRIGSGAPSAVPQHWVEFMARYIT